jgi:predicted secreted acid phosphatase
MIVHVFDIDRTLADGTVREKLAGFTGRSHTREQWDIFLTPENLAKDTPYEKAQHYVNKLRDSGAKILYVTGREESVRKPTVEWLEKHYSMHDSEKLIMRNTEEFKLKATEYKEKIANWLKNRYEDSTFIFYEDDLHILQMYSKYGVVLRCPEAWDVLVPLLPDSEEIAFTIKKQPL